MPTFYSGALHSDDNAMLMVMSVKSITPIDAILPHEECHGQRGWEVSFLCNLRSVQLIFDL